ncbi:MAG: hypothetical protein ACPGWR_00900 [Ardenticatenaceae bacterium]
MTQLTIDGKNIKLGPRGKAIVDLLVTEQSVIERARVIKLELDFAGKRFDHTMISKKQGRKTLD